MANSCEICCEILIAILLPPVGVCFRHGCCSVRLPLLFILHDGVQYISLCLFLFIVSAISWPFFFWFFNDSWKFVRQIEILQCPFCFQRKGVLTLSHFPLCVCGHSFADMQWLFLPSMMNLFISFWLTVKMGKGNWSFLKIVRFHVVTRISYNLIVTEETVITLLQVEFFICLLLTILGYIPGIIYALYAIVFVDRDQFFDEARSPLYA